MIPPYQHQWFSIIAEPDIVITCSWSSVRPGSASTRKMGGLILTLKGFSFFTAETQSTLRQMFFSFPVRGRKAKIFSPTGHNSTLVGDRNQPLMLVHHSKAD
jgi:hypothetical protein